MSGNITFMSVVIVCSVVCRTLQLTTFLDQTEREGYFGLFDY